MPEMWAGSDWTDTAPARRRGPRLVPVGAFVVRTGDHVALLDAGVGEVHDEMFDGGELLDSLRALDVDAGRRRHDRRVAPPQRSHGLAGARRRADVPERDRPHRRRRLGPLRGEALGGRKRAARLQAIEDHVSLVDRDGETIIPGLTTRLTPGHTPGHLSTVISSGTERMIVLGDSLHCPAQLTNTEWEFVFDVDPALARAPVPHWCRRPSSRVPASSPATSPACSPHGSSPRPRARRCGCSRRSRVHQAPGRDLARSGRWNTNSGSCCRWSCS